MGFGGSHKYEVLAPGIASRRSRTLRSRSATPRVSLGGHASSAQAMLRNGTKYMRDLPERTTISSLSLVLSSLFFIIIINTIYLSIYLSLSLSLYIYIYILLLLLPLLLLIMIIIIISSSSSNYYYHYYSIIGTPPRRGPDPPRGEPAEPPPLFGARSGSGGLLAKLSFRPPVDAARLGKGWGYRSARLNLESKRKRGRKLCTCHSKHDRRSRQPQRSRIQTQSLTSHN